MRPHTNYPKLHGFLHGPYFMGCHGMAWTRIVTGGHGVSLSWHKVKAYTSLVLVATPDKLSLSHTQNIVQDSKIHR